MADEKEHPKIDQALQDDLLDSLHDLGTEVHTVIENTEAQDERLTVLEEQNKTLIDKFDKLEAAKPVERKIKPLNWDYDSKMIFGKWYLDILHGKTTGAQQEGTDSEGGYLVPDDFVPEILRIIGEQSIFLSQARVIPMARLTLKIPKAGTTAASVAWTAEETAATESKVSFEEVTLTAQRLDAFSTVSNELLEDADVDVVDYLVELFTEAMAEEVDNQGFAGTGDPVSGLSTGACGYSVVMASGSLSMSDITADHLSEMISKVKPSVLSGCAWYVHPTGMHYVRILKDDQSRPIFQPPNVGAPGGIYGYPYYVSSKYPSTSEGASKPFINFANLKKAFIIGLRKKLEIESSRHLKIKENQTVIVYRMRLDLDFPLANAAVRLISAAS